MKQHYLLFLLFFITICTGCNGETHTCTLAVYSETAAIMEETSVDFKKGQSVIDILKTATRDAGIQMEYSGADFAVYVKGIDNLYEFDKGPESGWIYSVNGAIIQKSAGSVKPEAGDMIVWQYVTSTPALTP